MLEAQAETIRAAAAREKSKITSELKLKSEALENSLNGFDIVSSEGTFYTPTKPI